MVDVLTLMRCCGASREDARPYVEALNAAMPRFKINTHERIAAFLANVAVETARLTAVEENLYYTTPDRLRLIYPSLFVPPAGKYRAEEYIRRPLQLSQLKYRGYHGRGLMHLTWRDTYKAAGDALGYDYENDPALVMEPLHAALTACWFWTDYKNLNPYADRQALYEIRLRINGAQALGYVEMKGFRVAGLKHLRPASGDGTALA